MREKPLTERDLDTLYDLYYTQLQHERAEYKEGWVKCLDIGGGNGSHHSGTMVKLVKRGLVLVQGAREKLPWRDRWCGNKHYKITEAGKELLRNDPRLRATASELQPPSQT